jgi:hypothetical protein
MDNLAVYHEDEELPPSISITKELVYGEDKILGKIGDITVDSLGRLYVADVQRQLIQVFDEDGMLVEELGRQGRGPGEFGYIKKIDIRSDKLYVHDFRQNRVSLFSLENMEFLNSYYLARNKKDFEEIKSSYPFIDELFVKRNGHYLAKFKMDGDKNGVLWENFPIYGIYYSLNETGQINSDKLYDFYEATGTNFNVTPNSNVSLAFQLEQFFGKKIKVLSNKDQFYVSEPDNFFVTVYNSNGEYSRSFYRHHQKIAITKDSAIKSELPDSYIERMNKLELPEHWPVIIDMILDDQERIWIATTTENMKEFEWWGLQNTGESIFKFSWPRNEPIQFIQGDKIYAMKGNVINRYNFEATDN